MPFLLFRLRVGAREDEDPVGVLGHGGPGLLPRDHPAVGVAPGACPQARKVRSGAGFRKALAPPVAEVDDARQESLFLRLGAKGVDHRADHADAERDELGRIAALRLIEEDRELDRAPSGAAPFLRPVRGSPAFGGENTRPALIVVLGKAPAGDRLLADRRRQVVAHEGAHLGAKCELVFGQSQVHGDRLPYHSAPGSGPGARLTAQCRALAQRRQPFDRSKRRPRCGRQRT